MSGIADQQRFPGRAVAVVLAFAVLGPLAGATLLYLPVAVQVAINPGAQDGSGPAVHVEGLLQVFLFFATWGFLIGGLPAALAGAALGWSVFTTGTFGYLRSAVVSAVAAVVGGSLLFVLAQFDLASAAAIALWTVPCGIAAGLVLRLLLGFAGVVPARPNHARSA